MRSTLTLTSPSFENGTVIPSKYTCDSENINPPLIISGVPEETQSLVLIMDDPDSTIGTWDHWILFNIDPSTTEINENTTSLGLSGKGTGGNLDYFGPCPPDGEHQYFFKLYALDIILDLPEAVSKERVEKAMDGHILDKTFLTGRYSRLKTV